MRNEPTSEYKKAIMKVIEQVCEFYEININDLLSVKRAEKIVKARQVAIFLCYSKLKHYVTYSNIGYMFNRDHATVIHSINSVKSQMSVYDSFAKELAVLSNKLNIKMDVKIRIVKEKIMLNKYDLLLQFSKLHVTKTDSHEALVNNFIRTTVWKKIKTK